MITSSELDAARGPSITEQILAVTGAKGLTSYDSVAIRMCLDAAIATLRTSESQSKLLEEAVGLLQKVRAGNIGFGELSEFLSRVDKHTK